MNSESGFTLVEILITITIIGILAAVAILTSTQMTDAYKVRGAARQVYSDMQMTRLRAIKEGKTASFNFAGTTYTVLVGGTSVKTADITSNYSGVRICNAVNVQFNPNGTSSPVNSGVTISKGSRAQRVNMGSTGTGNIQIQNTAVCP